MTGSALCRCGHTRGIHARGEGDCWNLPPAVFEVDSSGGVLSGLCPCREFVLAKTWVRCSNGHSFEPASAGRPGSWSVTQPCPECGSLVSFKLNEDGQLAGEVHTSMPDGWLSRVLAFCPPLLHWYQERVR